MSVPPNHYNNIPGPPQMNANPGLQAFNHSQQFGQVPVNQLPPGYGLKQDSNSNSPHHVPTSPPQNNIIQNVNHYNQSGNSSPAFNQSGMTTPNSHSGLQSSPMRPPSTGLKQNPSSATTARTQSMQNSNPSPTPYTSNFQPQLRQINDNAPPLNTSSQFNQPLMNGPISAPHNQFPLPTSSFSPPPLTNMPPASAANFGPRSTNSQFLPPPVSKPPGPTNSLIGAVPPMSGPTTGSIMGPPTGPMSGPLRPLSGPASGPPSGPMGGPTNGPLGQMGRPSNGPLGPMGGPTNGPPSLGTMPGRPSQPLSGSVGGPNIGPPLGPPRALGVNGPNPPGSQLPPSIPVLPMTQQKSQTGGLPAINTVSGPPSSIPQLQAFPGPLNNGPSGPPLNAPGAMGMTALSGPPLTTGPQSLPNMGPQSLPPMGAPSGPTSPPMGPGKSNMQSRYPQMPPSNYPNHQPQMQTTANMTKQYPQQYNTQALNQQMGQLSVTKQGFDQLWGHHMIDLLQCRHILPEYPEDPPEIKLTQHFADASNCSPEIFRCTVNRIPETNSLLQKSRLPLGILIHPFKDLNHLPVIQCNTIVRCRSCRTYINPFVYFVDAKRWKCNLCYRVNDLPEEFQYDPVSKSYGDPSRRPEIKSATIEFIAPGEYMLRPPQPAVYLFLFDVSHLARDSGYLQVVCDTLKNNLDQLPGDARTQVGFICYDTHVHYYLMSEGLTRPKEMTVLDVDDVFLPSPSSLLVNLGERMALVKELLTVLPARYTAPGAPGSALGPALQAAYKLMAPTGGRITVFQTCLPNIGPGALQPREDPNARSSKDVAHLNPATDFYKRLALDCSGAQVCVDLFLLNSQYSDLATLSGMSKFSAGTVYHMPLFRVSRGGHADRLCRVLTRYLTRKIGFEAVMRVRCTRGITIHTFHGNFFVRSTDLLSLPNVSPDAGFGMQLTIEESLSDLQQVCFQAALLYTSSKGERRIRVHTLALPIASNLTDVLHSADQQCIIGLLSKMAVDRSVSASLSEAREAVMNVAVEALSAHRLAQNLPAGAAASALHAPAELRLLPLYLLALLKRRAFRTGTSTRLDDRVADMCALKCAPLAQLVRAVYPALYPVHALHEYARNSDAPDPPQLHLTAERVNSNGAYLLDDGETMILYVGHKVSAAFLSETFAVTAFSQLPDEARALPRPDGGGNALLHAFIERLNDDRPYASDLIIIRDNSPSRLMFTERLVDDRVESAFSYYEFLQHVKNQVK